MTTQQRKQCTFQFGARVVTAVDALPESEAARILGQTLLRVGSSVGAHYRAAPGARSCADFVAEVGVVEAERNESSYGRIDHCAQAFETTDN